MEAVFNDKGQMIGDIDICEDGGFFATLIDNNYNQIKQSFFWYEDEAEKWLKKESLKPRQ